MLNVNALFDPESADIHEAAINAELQRDHRPNDDRTMGQRRADALTNLMRNRSTTATSAPPAPRARTSPTSCMSTRTRRPTHSWI
jgi:hypothetical protein